MPYWNLWAVPIFSAAVGALLIFLSSQPAVRGQTDNVVPPTHKVTLRKENIPLTQALKELETQTGIAVGSALKNDPPLALNFTGLSFWQALDTIANQAKARVSLYQRDGQVVLVDAAPNQEPQPVSYDKLFRFTVRRITATEDFEAGIRRYVAHLALAWQPGFRPVFLETQSQSVTVEDDQARVLKPPSEGSSQYPVGQPRATEVEIPLPAFPRATGKIGLLKGSVTLTGAAKMLRFTFDAIAEGKMEQEGVMVKLRQVVTRSEPWTVQVELIYPPNGLRFESYENWLLHNEVFLVNKDGKRRFPATGHSIEELKSDRAVITYYFAETKDKARGMPGDWKLEYWTPSQLLQTRVSFTFKDLRLP
jgi:hypothetical protein